MNEYQKYKDILQRAADLNYASAVLGWDLETYMPAKGSHFRGRQLATLSAMAHEMSTSEELGHLLHRLNSHGGLTETEVTNVRRSTEDYDKQSKLPAAFVEQLTLQSNECFGAWIAARKQNDFKVFAPSLKEMIALKREQARLYGFTGHPYNALLHEYEPGADVAFLDGIFDTIKALLPPVLNKIRHAPQVRDDFFLRHYPTQLQWNFSITVLQKMGYDMEAGRQDYSEHPFTTSFSPKDVRVTTRADEHNFAYMLWSTIHEGGHALYEQGLPDEQYGLPLGAAASLGIHESQSRLWENCVGRSRDFWTYFYPVLLQTFPEQLADVSADEFFKAANKVSPSLIRTEADEVTYHFHVLIRYEIEKALLEGSLEAEAIPGAWNSLYHKYLGVTPPDDKTGALQDVHWSHGSFGYFPTYTLGSFYGLQFYEQAEKDIPNLKQLLADGNFTPLLQWLRENVHCYGRQYYSDELCRKVTGRPLDATVFLNYVKRKYEDVYAITL